MLYALDNYLLAPLCGYTDVAFRRSCRRYGMIYGFTPLVEAGALIYKNPTCERILFRGKDEPWLAAQLLGGNAEVIEEGLKVLLNDYNWFDVIDLNLGCPVPKVIKKGAGAALGRNLSESVRCLERMVKMSPVPITAKTRIVSENDPEATLKLARALEGTGIQALTIHGRILERRYGGPVFADMIKAIREELSIPVIANGGVFNLQTARELQQHSGCEKLMLARGAIGNPWIFQELSVGEAFVLPTHEEICNELEVHIHDMLDFFGEETGIRNSRKLILAYLTGRGYAASLREAVSHLNTRADFCDLLVRIRQMGQSPDYLKRPMGRQGIVSQLV